LIRQKRARQHLQQRRLAGPIGSDKTHTVAAQDTRGKIPHDHSVAEALFQSLCFYYQLAREGSIAGSHSRNALGAAMVTPTCSQGLQFGETPDIAPAPCRHAITQPVLLAGNLAAELFLFALLLLQGL